MTPPELRARISDTDHARNVAEMLTVIQGMTGFETDQQAAVTRYSTSHMGMGSIHGVVVSSDSQRGAYIDSLYAEALAQYRAMTASNPPQGATRVFEPRTPGRVEPARPSNPWPQATQTATSTAKRVAAEFFGTDNVTGRFDIRVSVGADGRVSQVAVTARDGVTFINERGRRERISGPQLQELQTRIAESLATSLGRQTFPPTEGGYQQPINVRLTHQ